MPNHLLPAGCVNFDALAARPRARLRFTPRGWYRFAFLWIRRADAGPEDVWVGPFTSYADALRGYTPVA